MRKTIALLAVSTLLVSSFAMAEETTTQTNPNDVLQTIPHQEGNTANNPGAPTTIADSSDAAAQPIEKEGQAAAPEERKPAKHKGKKHHAKKHHHKKHHKAAAAAPATPAAN